MFDNEQKKVLKAQRNVSSRFESMLDAACTSARAMTQFERDLRVYGLYEACLYLINMRDAGYFTDRVDDAIVTECRRVLTPPPAKRAIKKIRLDDLI